MGIGMRGMAAVALAAGLTGGMAAAPAAQQERQMGGVGITVYEDVDYGGQNATFRSDTPDLGRVGFKNKISSLQVAPGEMWEVCEGVNYRGPCQVFSGTEPNLVNRSWNDRISSLRRVRGGRGGGGGGGYPPPRGLVLYSDESFRGQSRTITGPTSALGSYNDKARSVRVYSGVWEICEDIDYGKCRLIDRDYSNLGSLGLSKRVSSVRPAARPR